MDPREVVISGRSEVKKIRIGSHKFASTATYNEEKDQVTVEIDRDENIKDDLTDKDWKFHGWFLLGVFLSYLSLAGFSLALVTENPLLSNTLALASIAAFVLVMYKILSFLVNQMISVVRVFGWMKKVAPWHGAEHKVIESYWATGTTDLETARKTSPISDKCGGRIAVLYLLALGAIFASAITFALGGYKAFMIIIGLTILATLIMVVLRRTTMKCAVHLSRQLQKHWMTKEPGEKELWTAHCAIVELLKAEARSENLEDFSKYSITYDRRP
ncbi:MAG: hypothetical protein G01um101419_248 [Parcubacteria group bacterium Gr01-1014_19]|nr:MAG: hypothetical protein G01um101419_248 [Parcubacteria group bacterium Gr01-1014_19]